MPDLFRLRPGRESDHAFVVDTWLKSNMHSPRAKELLEQGIYWTEAKALVRKLLASNRLRVAHALDDQEAILGWACVSNLDPPDNLDPIVHFVYVRGGRGEDAGGARRCGIATALLGAFLKHPFTYTHKPENPRIPIPKDALYNPERVYR